MSPELIKIIKKVDSFREVLKQNGFEILQCFWYSDGRYCGNWKDMSIAKEKPDIEEALTFWQFSFRSQNEKNKKIHLEAVMPVFEDYFTFDLRYYPEVKLHDRKGYSGPTAKLEICGILEEDLIYLQKHIDYLLNLK